MSEINKSLDIAFEFKGNFYNLASMVSDAKELLANATRLDNLLIPYETHSTERFKDRDDVLTYITDLASLDRIMDPNLDVTKLHHHVQDILERSMQTAQND